MTAPTDAPPPSRPITPRARRRSWAELHVRPWVLLTSLFLIAAVVMTATRLAGVARERRVIQSGTTVTAKVVQVGMSPQHQAERNETLFVALEYTPPGTDKPLYSAGYLPRKPGTVVKNKGTIDVKIDPADPMFFTDREGPPPLTAELGVPMLLLGVSAICMVFTMLARRTILHTFARGTLRPATVVSVKQTPAAPMSKQIGFTINDVEDRRVYQCLWPNKLGAITPGQAVQLIVPADPSRSVAAAAYDIER